MACNLLEGPQSCVSAAQAALEADQRYSDLQISQRAQLEVREIFSFPRAYTKAPEARRTRVASPLPEASVVVAPNISVC